MRFSDIKGERVLDVIADVAAPISRIVSDKEVADYFKAAAPKKGQTAEQAFAERMGDAIPVLIRGHKRDIVAIFAAIEGVSQEEYERDMTLASFLADVRDKLTDSEFVAFFTSQDGAKS